MAYKGNQITWGRLATSLKATITNAMNTITNHVGVKASTETLGHIKPDGETITVDPVTGVAKVIVDIGGGLSAKSYTGDLNSLVESGIYSCPANTPNAPNSFPLLVEVLASYDSNFVIQRATYDHLGTANIPAFTRRAIKNASGDLVWSTPNAGSVGFVNNWRVVDFILSDSLTDANTSAAATANAVKQVNDKFTLPTRIDVVFNTGWSSPLGEPQLHYYKDAFGVVTIFGTVRRTPTGSGSFATLPSGYRPLTNMKIYVPHIANKIIPMDINASTGAMTLNAFASEETLYLNISYRTT